LLTLGPLTGSFYQHLKADHVSPVAGFVFDVLTQRYALIQSGGYYFWDPLAAAILTDESLATFQTRALSIIEFEVISISIIGFIRDSSS
jgi:inosine-uridine nucleoside N-ribohydrolase